MRSYRRPGHLSSSHINSTVNRWTETMAIRAIANIIAIATMDISKKAGSSMRMGSSSVAATHLLAYLLDKYCFSPHDGQSIDGLNARYCVMTCLKFQFSPQLLHCVKVPLLYTFVIWRLVNESMVFHACTTLCHRHLDNANHHLSSHQASSLSTALPGHY